MGWQFYVGGMSGNASTHCNCALAPLNPYVGVACTKAAHLLHPSLILVALCFVSPCIANAAGVRPGDVPCLTGGQPDNLKKHMALLRPYTSDPDRVGELLQYSTLIAIQRRAVSQVMSEQMGWSRACGRSIRECMWSRSVSGSPQFPDCCILLRQCCCKG